MGSIFSLLSFSTVLLLVVVSTGVFVGFSIIRFLQIDKQYTPLAW